MSYRSFKTLDLPSIDKEVNKFWQDQRIFEKSTEESGQSESFVFYEGPPSANGKPGIHHVISRTVKDLFCRYHTMLGKRVLRKGGWDTHGLPIELTVEKELGITKEDIGTKISIADYNAECRKTVMRFKDLWDDLTRKMGYWVDLEKPYMTFDNDYIESVWYMLKRLYDKGLLYKGYTIQPYSPAAGTGLSSHELNMPGAYKEVKDISAAAQFKIIKNERSAFLFDDQIKSGDLYFLAWTTTPWTLPSNTALAVSEKISYIRIFTNNPYTGLPVNLILAEDLLHRWFKQEEATMDVTETEASESSASYRITGHYRGSDFEGISYEQLLPFAQPEDGDAFKVLLGDFVSTDDGTGIVHVAPSFGTDDMRVARKYGIGSLTLVDRQGKFTKQAGEFAGRYVKDYTDDPHYENVDIDITVKLKKENKVFNVQKYSHNYPHCWRTDKPILYYPMDSWFIQSTKVKDRMVELNKDINWKPQHTGEKRFGHWLENLQDWNLSRSRYWGIPLPIWRTADAGFEKCIGSLAELETEILEANRKLHLNQKIPADLHRPYIDEIVLVSPKGESMRREEDLIDVWFDSGSMPYAQWHYPFENQKEFHENFPADFIAEGVDQTRGWFFTLHAISVMAFDSIAFKNVVSNGLVLDKEGRKMSKRLGNSAEPFETLEKYGADATRWYMISNAQPWDNLKFDVAGIEEVQRKFFGTLFNTYAFFSLYANIDEFYYKEEEVPHREKAVIDRWILSVLHTLIKEVNIEYAAYEPTNVTRLINDFVNDHLSNWYVRLSRRRFWKGEYTTDKISAYQTLYTCLGVVAKLMAPVSPFFAEWLYLNLNQATGKESFESVHLSRFPTEDALRRDDALEQRMSYAQKISSLILSLRKKENIRVRQPLKRVLLPVLDPDFKKQVLGVKDLIMSEVNIKDIEFITDTGGLIKKRIKPNFKMLGKRLGNQMKEASEVIQKLEPDQIENIEKTGRFDLTIAGQNHELTLEDVIISSEDIPGWQVASEGDITVALDISLDSQLIAEGTARELVNRIQNIRKQRDFNVTDRIIVSLEDHESVMPAIEHFGDYIKDEVLAKDIQVMKEPGGEEVELLDGIMIQISLSLA